jgi:hypothetical protein
MSSPSRPAFSPPLETTEHGARWKNRGRCEMRQVYMTGTFCRRLECGLFLEEGKRGIDVGFSNEA